MHFATVTEGKGKVYFSNHGYMNIVNRMIDVAEQDQVTQDD